jgi:hypothetical protein
MRGWVTPSDDYESDTNNSLKTVVEALNAGERGVEIPSKIFNGVEWLLYKWSVFIRQGIREKIGGHRGVSWYLSFSEVDARAFINFQEGPNGEWFYDCYADEVPLWLLLGLFKRIRRRKPLGDQNADDIIEQVDNLDAAYVRTTATTPHYTSYVEDDND